MPTSTPLPINSSTVQEFLDELFDAVFFNDFPFEPPIPTTIPPVQPGEPQPMALFQTNTLNVMLFIYDPDTVDDNGISRFYYFCPYSRKEMDNYMSLESSEEIVRKYLIENSPEITAPSALWRPSYGAEDVYTLLLKYLGRSLKGEVSTFRFKIAPIILTEDADNTFIKEFWDAVYKV